MAVSILRHWQFSLFVPKFIHKNSHIYHIKQLNWLKRELIALLTVVIFLTRSHAESCLQMRQNKRLVLWSAYPFQRERVNENTEKESAECYNLSLVDYLFGADNRCSIDEIIY